ncbi:peptidase inhibitor family I36 protein [Rhodococcus erythropolis]|nr:peptidase inhibitor family I36 protein [Rhodococcus erythropolis]
MRITNNISRVAPSKPLGCAPKSKSSPRQPDESIERKSREFTIHTTISARRNTTKLAFCVPLRLLTLVAFATGLLGISVAPASALSLYDHAGYQGGYRTTSSSNSDSTYHNKYFTNTFRLWDEVSSLRNNNGGWFNFHHDTNYTGPYLHVPAGAEYSYVGDTHNDRFSSHY